jgi:hypothetical protein
MNTWTATADVAIKGAAVLGAAGFFLYKILSGSNNQNLSLVVSCNRTRIGSLESGFDSVAANISIEKGTTAALALEGLEVLFRWGEEPTSQRNIEVDIGRLAVQQEGMSPKLRIAWNKPDADRPYLYISPGEKTNFACAINVPSGSTCTVQVAAFGKRRRSTFRAQWRASSIALPLPERKSAENSPDDE